MTSADILPSLHKSHSHTCDREVQLTACGLQMGVAALITVAAVPHRSLSNALKARAGLNGLESSWDPLFATGTTDSLKTRKAA